MGRARTRTSMIDSIIHAANEYESHFFPLASTVEGDACWILEKEERRIEILVKVGAAHLCLTPCQWDKLVQQVAESRKEIS